MQKTLTLTAVLYICVSLTSAQTAAITNVGKTVDNMDAITFSSNGTLYGGTSGAGSLYTIDPKTGAATLVHALVGASNSSLTYGVTGLAFQPGTGVLYASTSPDSPNSGNSLVTINPANGQVTVIGASGTGRPYTDIAFAPNGTLYGWLIGTGATTISAATINLTTGAGTSLGSPQTPVGLPDGGGLAVNSSGVIYVAANGHAGGVCSPTTSCTGDFWTINGSTGAPTKIGTLMGGPGSAPTITALAFAPNGVLYGIEGGDGGASWNLIIIAVPGQPAPGGPSINYVSNAASNIGPGMPNAGIAQGALFVVYGSVLGPANIIIAPSAFQSTVLSGTSVAVTVNGTTVNALMYYTSATQVAALLPSNTPTGTGTITVTNNGTPSLAAPITVVANNPGIFTIDASGTGPGIVTYPDYSLVSPTKAANCGGPSTTCGAANPGDTLILWATGLGPVNGSDAAGAGLGQAINVPLTLWLGGVQAPVVYQGRSGCCIGEDQIVFTVPSSAPTGCAVPLVLQVGNEVSNSVYMPVANGSRTCPLLNSEVSTLGAQQIEQLVTGGPLSFGSIRLNHFSDGNGTFEDDSRFQFLKVTSFTPGSQPFFASYIDDLPSGTCSVGNPSFPATAASGLDAGSSFTVTGPKGNVTLPLTAQNSAFNMTGAFLVPGSYTITGTGGADVGSFNAAVTIPAAATLTTPVSGGTATRANGMTVTWTGGSGTYQIQVSSCADNLPGVCNNVTCFAQGSTGTLTIPSYVLQALPAGTAGLVLSSQGEGSFTATGLNAGVILAYSDVAGFGYGWGSGSFTLK